MDADVVRESVPLAVGEAVPVGVCDGVRLGLRDGDGVELDVADPVGVEVGSGVPDVTRETEGGGGGGRLEANEAWGRLAGRTVGYQTIGWQDYKRVVGRGGLGLGGGGSLP